jgi:AraC-like DNA-binding protein
MRLEFFIPSPPLSHYVKRYAFYQFQKEEAPGGIKILPMGYAYVVVNLCERFSIESPRVRGETVDKGPLLVGQQDIYYQLMPSGNLTSFSIIFKPAGMYRLLHTPMHELRGYGYPAGLVIRNLLDLLYEQLRRLSPDSHAMARAADDFLLKQLGMKDSRYPYIEGALECIDNHKGLVGREELYRLANVSGRTFRRRFLEIVGTSCKHYILITRLGHIMSALKGNRPPSLGWGKIAHNTGFYDQMHFIRSFRQILGETPSHYINRFNNPENILERYFLAAID